MRTPVRIVCTALALVPGLALAQDRITIDDFAFLTGYWVGAGLGGVAEEIWMPPADGRMFGIFKHSGDGALNFSEYMEITRQDGQWVLRLKHFGADFGGWEHQDEHVTFPLASVQDKAALFEGLTYRVEDDGQLEVTVTLQQSDGRTVVETLNYRRRDLSPANER